MESKNKSEKNTNPERNSQNEKVVVGISGSVDSLVAAYLLKIQRHHLLAFTVVNVWEDLTKESPTAFSCHLSEEKLKGISEFCHRLNIPHQVIRVGDEFMEKVVDVWVTDQLQGKSSKHCGRCQELRMTLLFQKMKHLGATRFATGHYAKIFQTESNGRVLVHTSNEPMSGHAGILSTLPQEILSSLILPLADLTQKEVMVLAENFGISDISHPKKKSDCLTLTPELFPYLEKRVPHDLQERMGINLQSEKPMALTLLERMNHASRIDNKVWVVKGQLSSGMQIFEPTTGHLMFKDEKEVECWITPKTLSSFYVEFKESFKLVPGEFVSVTKKKGRNSKVLFTGELKLLPVVEEGEQSVTQVDATLDF